LSPNIVGRNVALITNANDIRLNLQEQEKEIKTVPLSIAAGKHQEKNCYHGE
jgi:hypothetical protein